MFKKCIKCFEIKDISLFYKKPRSSDGHHSYCKQCHNVLNKIYSVKWRQTEKGKQYIRNKSRENRRLDKWILYGREYAKKYQASSVGLVQRRIIDRRKRNNPAFRASSNISRALRLALLNNKAGRHWEDIVGYTLGDLKTHLEKQFTPNMTWNNYGLYWHIDHIIPRSYFTAKQIKSCWTLSNLRPLEARENLAKSNFFSI